MTTTGIQARSRSLESFPIELLYEIQYYALSSSLPLTSKHFYAVFKSAPSSFHAQYLVGRYFHSERTTARTTGLFTTVLRYPICSQEVLEAVVRSKFDEVSYPRGRKGVVIELPRRLFRTLAPRTLGGQGKPNHSNWSENDTPLPFLRYLYDHPRLPPPFIDSYDGYALTKAVYAGFIPLVRFLLAHGASPAYKDGIAVMVAIRRKDLALVRMLVERDHRGVNEQRTSCTGKGKRRKLGDRVRVNPQMLKAAVKCDARDIVEYLMREKGCIPDMQTVLLMGSR
ncbi:hypothetical protein BKA93DRAFT_792802 [Sparassis latifolia]